MADDLTLRMQFQRQIQVASCFVSFRFGVRRFNAAFWPRKAALNRRTPNACHGNDSIAVGESARLCAGWG